MRRFFLFIFTLFLVCIPTQSIYAADFSADYDVDYAISPTGTTIVTQKITLTNNETNYYPKQYSIIIDTQKIKNVIAYDSKGMINPTIEQKDGKTEIGLKFNDKVVGKGKTLAFELRYEHGDIAVKNGRIWEVNIPGIEDDPTIGTYTVNLRTPATFGTTMYMKPAPLSGRKWVKHQMTGGGISAAYGTSQEFTAQLTYDIENEKLTSADYEIALPPDTAFQKIVVKSIDPKPKSTRTDEDGNWLATFTLAGSQKITVSTVLGVTTYIKPRTDYKKITVVSTQYLQPQTYWESTDPVIKALAAKYKTPKDIYEYVVSTLNYSYDRMQKSFTRKGAKEALVNPADSICSEFTDLFIAVARAAGIPAREVVGYAYTTNVKLRPIASGALDILHAWPEYYDSTQKVWIPVDPTWKKTTKGIDYFDTLDFNHIAFAIHGVSSEYPYPAGSYKQGSIPKKNVSIAFSDVSQKIPENTIKTTITIPPEVTLGSAVTGEAIIQNTSGVAIDQLVINIQSEPFPFSVTKYEDNIPPYGVITIPINIQTSGIFSTQKGKITVSVNDEVSTFTYALRPMYWLIIPAVLAIIGLALLIWILSHRR